jgi:hypothetical protein
MDITRKIMKKQKDRRKNKDNRFKGIENFIKGDLYDKKKTATGYSHKMKTGGSN